jgi:hypothetical protein
MLNPAGLLWLIRQGTTTWNGLRQHFDGTGLTFMYQLQAELVHLQGAGLIEVVGDDERVFQIFPSYDLVDSNLDIAFSMTRVVHEFLHITRLSLTELAQSQPENRMIVNPLLRRTRGTQYKSDILVFMPFEEALRPVYEDLKSVAAKLEQASNALTTSYQSRSGERDLDGPS